jgi:YidC/Oxa1 family membrane protein insertase
VEADVLEAASSPIALLARGLSALLGALVLVTDGAVGWAIVLLALVVRLACTPLLRIAERWQRQVDELWNELAPEVGKVRAHYRGEERGRRLLELYRVRGVHPLFGLRNLLGVAIQVPVFLAAYHALDANPLLFGATFLWVDDLARPDRVAALPVALPGLGDGVHVLPILMASATLLASWLHGGAGLPARRQRARRAGLYLLALAFFLLLYAFPAGMVLYWATGSFASLARACARRWLPALAPRPVEVRGVAVR